MMSRISKWGLALCAALPLVGLSVDSNGAADRRGYGAGSFGLELDGASMGFVKSVEGGTIVGEVVQEPAGAAAFPKKHIGNVQYEDIIVDVGMSMGKPLLDWIAATLEGRAQRKNGAIVTYDYKLDALQSRQFTDALLIETIIPACDAASKDPAYFGLRIAPERLVVGKGSGKAASAAGKADQKLWIPSNFRFELDGLDTSKVSRVDEFSIETKTSRSANGNERGASKEPGKLEIPNLKVTFAAVSAEPWNKWHADMVVAGGGDKLEKSGRLVFLAPNRQQELLEIKFHGVGIVALRSPKESSNAEGVAKVEAELYCERMELVQKPAQ